MSLSCTGLNHRNWPIKLHLFRGIDIGQADHHATAVTPDGTVVHDKSLPPSEPRIQELLKDLVAQHAKLWVVVDQPKTIGTLVIAIAQQLGIQMPYEPSWVLFRPEMRGWNKTQDGSQLAATYPDRINPYL
ncbi:IS110 family transposase [Auritidibacter ignavus]|uniref:IS110 family transposase n=1 Tax=Auritidibacter ignavus TaxID=678932 RepID=UPI0024BA1CBA|nr:transposase [Auritidibacter ignavus]WHS34728.1 transposase [Auritidibacter ignavus]